jgi:hypothetical protein
MRVMIVIKANKESEAGLMPSQAILEEMGKYNEELVKAGVMLAADGLHASSKGARVRFTGGKATVIDGPFAETKELIAGYWLWQVKSKEEAIEWLKRGPWATGSEEFAKAEQRLGPIEIEIRQVVEAEDLGPEYSEQLRQQDERLRAQAAAKA